METNCISTDIVTFIIILRYQKLPFPLICCIFIGSTHISVYCIVYCKFRLKYINCFSEYKRLLNHINYIILTIFLLNFYFFIFLYVSNIHLKCSYEYIYVCTFLSLLFIKILALCCLLFTCAHILCTNTLIHIYQV